MQAPGSLHDSTKFTWQGFKFCKTYTDYIYTGWEVTCRAPDHYNKSNQCRRRRNFGSRCSEADVFRKLKWWCAQGPSISTRQDHVDLEQIPLSDMPSLAELGSNIMSFE